METSPAKAIQYFNGEKQNLIPLFQRPYRWENQNWNNLWGDLMIQYEQDGNTNHFMGAIVSVPAKSIPVGVSKYLIIDGQQRLTTISILLCALRDHFDSIDDKNSSDRIQEVYLINRFREIDDTLKFVPTQIDREIYKNIALEKSIPTGKQDHLMVGCYNFFRTKINGNDNNDNKIIPRQLLTTPPVSD